MIALKKINLHTVCCSRTYMYPIMNLNQKSNSFLRSQDKHNQLIQSPSRCIGVHPIGPSNVEDAVGPELYALLGAADSEN